MEKRFNIMFLFVFIVGVIICCTACSSGSIDEIDTVPTYDVKTSAYLDDLYEGNSRKETVYGGTVTDKFKFEGDGTVTWGQCYSATGKCLGVSYTYQKNGLDITIYNNNNVKYSCYLVDSADVIKCKHSVDINHYGYISYYRAG